MSVVVMTVGVMTVGVMTAGVMRRPHNYSMLNYDLFRFNLKGNPGCASGFECVIVFHIFLECPINELIRNTLFLILQIYGAIDIDIILMWKRKLN